MTWIVLILGAAVLFIIGIISPHAGGKIQRKTDKKAGKLKRLANWFWDPITWWMQQTIEVSRKVIKKAIEWGKKIRVHL